MILEFKNVLSLFQKQKMKLILFFLSVSVSFISLSQKKESLNIKKGNWISELKLNTEDVLPFNMIVTKQGSIIVENGEEQIVLEKIVFNNDSFYVKFPYFNSELVFARVSKNQIRGFWKNYAKGQNYKIAFESKRKNDLRFSHTSTSVNTISIDGKWKVEFEPKTKSSYPAVGLFQQKDNTVSGTFLTETGDYRFLAGNTHNDSLYLSCFDGSHAFLFKAALLNDSLYGTFNSGNHWKSEWMAVKDNHFELTNPEELTYLKEDKVVSFSFKDIEGVDFSYPNEHYKNKVTIVQIMGTWCPNCLDEAMYYKSLYEKYHDKGLEIISICYEAGKTEEEQLQSIKNYKEKLAVDFTFLVGGTASKNKAANDFNMLNNIISFPTSIFIGRDGEVKRVHTGFNGPGTGVYYDEYVKKTNAFIESLMAY